MPIESDIELRSDEAQEILGTGPNFMVRYGTWLSFLGLLVILVCLVKIKYPETISDAVKIISTDPPRPIYIEQGNGGFVSELLVQDEDTVVEGQVLMVFTGEGKFEDVMTLSNTIARYENANDSLLVQMDIPDNLLLGITLNEEVDAFREAQESLRFYMRNRGGGSRAVRRIERDIRQWRREINNLREREKQVKEGIILAQRSFDNFKNMYENRQITKEEVDKAEMKLNELERELSTIRSQKSDRKFNIDMAELRMMDAKDGNNIDQNRYAAGHDLVESFLGLKNKLEAWERKYIHYAPLDGTVVFLADKIAEGQYLEDEQAIMHVVPKGVREPVGEMNVPLEGSGRIAEGQEVVIKLDRYPFAEFGAVRGVVKSKKERPRNNRIAVEVVLPKGLNTTAGHDLELEDEMVGKAEIILQEKALIEHLLGIFNRG